MTFASAYSRAQTGRHGFALASLLLLMATARAESQMTIGGRVTSRDLPVAGATVAIRDLDLATRTNADGVYNFLVAAAQVRGQRVTIVARHGRHGSRSAQVVIAGDAIVQDFALGGGRDSAVAPGPGVARLPGARVSDSGAFRGVVGPTGVGEALMGRFPGLRVIAGRAGGVSPMVYRGPRSVVASTQPLVVVDGVVLGNTSVTSALQQFGLGGFDYGTGLQALAVDDVATVTLLHGAAAAPLYGSRAANGVLLIATKRRASEGGWNPIASVRVSGEDVIGLPAYQDRYGQGLGGQFEFFDGRGGGINDDVDQSWGPALDGQPLAQASLTEPNRPDVRHWLAHPAGFDKYFQSGRTMDGSVSLDLVRPWGSGRVALNARDLKGVTPGFASRRLGLAFNGAVEPSARFNASLAFQATGTDTRDRPGTGYGEVNPVSLFVRIPRQVDLDALRSPLVVSGEQVNWIYTGRNNPFYQSLRNANDDSRSLVRGGAVLRYLIGAGVAASAQVGGERTNEDRNISVASGWKGEYPTSFGFRDFSDGGTETQSVVLDERIIGLTLSAAGRRLGPLSVDATVGAERRSNTFRFAALAADTSVVSGGDSSDVDGSSLYLTTSASAGAWLMLDAGLRAEKSSHHPSALGWLTYPSASLTYDARGTLPASARTAVGGARLRASWWQAGNELLPWMLRRAYGGWGTSDAPLIGLLNDSLTAPEQTTGIEITASIASAAARLAADVALYSERTRDAFIETPGVSSRSAVITNRGVEAGIRLAPLGAPDTDTRWQISATFARNRNRVERVDAAAADAALGPPRFGAWLVARQGLPFGAIMGQRFLRDSASGALLLRNGLPIAESGVSVLGNIQPDWVGSIRNEVRLGVVTVGFMFDGRVGGHVFSATNLWGSFAGTLESTVAGRETGRLIAGLDSATGMPNADTVSTEAYFHALGSIHEAFVYDATFWKLRELRLAYSVPLGFLPGFQDRVLTASLIGRNLHTWSKAPNIDPEGALSTGPFRGFEMGQLPQTRSFGVQFGIAP